MVDLRLPAFIPYLAVGAAHLVTLFVGWDAWSTPTKLAIMPALLLGFLIALPQRRGSIAILGSALKFVIGRLTRRSRGRQAEEIVNDAG